MPTTDQLLRDLLEQAKKQTKTLDEILNTLSYIEQNTGER